MTKLKTVRLHVEPSVYDKFKEEATRKGISTASLIRLTMYDRVERAGVAMAAPVQEAARVAS